MKKESIRNKFIRSFLIIGIVPSLLVMLIMYFGISNHLEQQTGKNLKRLAVETSLRVDMFIQNKVDNILKYASYSTIKRIYFPGSNKYITSEFIRSLFKFDSDLYNIALLDNNLKLLTSYRPNIQFMSNIHKHQKIISSLKQTETSLLFQINNKFNNKNRLNIMTPLYSDINNKKIGIMVATFDMQSLENLIEEIPISGKYYISLMSFKGKLLASTRPNMKNGKISDNILEFINTQKEGWTTIFDQSFKSQALLGFAASAKTLKKSLKTQPLYVYVSRTQDDAFEPVFSLLIKLFALSIIIVLSILYLFTSRIDALWKPIVSLQKSAELMGKGEFQLLSFEPTGDELEDLANSFNRMGENLKSSTKMLEEQNERLIKLNNIKNDFISMVSHELRTPLMIIKEALSQVLDGLKGEVPKEQKDFLSMAFRNAGRLNQIIHDLLSISEIERGKMKFKRKNINLIKIVNDEMDNQQIKSNEKNIILQKKFNIHQDLQIYCDADKIQIIFTNLLGNAIKFTQNKGNIIVTIEDFQSEIKISIKDNGPGIPKDSLNKVFERFFRLNSTPLVGAPSTGLGLAIAKELIDMHNGKIWVESDGENGSTFFFTLPKYINEDYIKVYLKDQIIEANDKKTPLTIFNIFTGCYDENQKESYQEELKNIYEQLAKFDYQYLYDSFEIIYLEKELELFIVAPVNAKKASAINARIRDLLINHFAKTNVFDNVYANIISASLNNHGITAEDLFNYLNQLKNDTMDRSKSDDQPSLDDLGRRLKNDRRSTDRRDR